MMIHGRFDPLSCSLKGVHASMNEYHHMICIGKTKFASEKGLLLEVFGLLGRRRHTAAAVGDLMTSIQN